MLKRFCDSCGKAVKDDNIGVDVAFERYHFCTSCIKSISGFLVKVIKKKDSGKR